MQWYTSKKKAKGNLTYTFQSGDYFIKTGFEGYGRVNLG
jgi:hypothetical protein